MEKQYDAFSIFTIKEHEETYRSELLTRLREGSELSELDRNYLADGLMPKKQPKQKLPAHRPKGSKTTTVRNYKLCTEYLSNYSGHGDSDTAFINVAEANKMEVSALRKAVSGELLFHVRMMSGLITPDTLQEKK